jgi:hypothetical protein
MANVLHGAWDPRVAPRGILLRHAPDETADLREDAATARPNRVRPLPGNELTVPAEQRVGCDD